MSDESALGQLVAILDAQVSRLDAIVGNGGAAETKASGAVDAATAWGAQEHVQAAEEVRKEIAEANAAMRQCKERYEAALTRAHSLEHGGGSGRSTANASGSGAAGGAAESARRTGRHRQLSYSRWRASGKHRVEQRRRIPTQESVTLGLSSLSTVAAGVNHVLPGPAQTAVNVALAGGGTVSAYAALRTKMKQKGQQDANRSQR